MQYGFSFVGVICYVMLDVSNNGGKYGRRRSTLNTGCGLGKGGMLKSKALSPISLVMVYGPY